MKPIASSLPKKCFVCDSTEVTKSFISCRGRVHYYCAPHARKYIVPIALAEEYLQQSNLKQIQKEEI